MTPLATDIQACGLGLPAYSLSPAIGIGFTPTVSETWRASARSTNCSNQRSSPMPFSSTRSDSAARLRSDGVGS